MPSYVIKDLWSFIKHNENLKLKDIIPGILQDSKSTPVVGMRAREEKIEKKKLYPMDVRLGIGLPMAQAYANYWGGSIKLHSMVGHGADAYVTINTINSFESMAEVDE